MIERLHVVDAWCAGGAGDKEALALIVVALRAIESSGHAPTCEQDTGASSTCPSTASETSECIVWDVTSEVDTSLEAAADEAPETAVASELDAETRASDDDDAENVRSILTPDLAPGDLDVTDGVDTCAAAASEAPETKVAAELDAFSTGMIALELAPIEDEGLPTQDVLEVATTFSEREATLRHILAWVNSLGEGGLADVAGSLDATHRKAIILFLLVDPDSGRGSTGLARCQSLAMLKSILTFEPPSVEEEVSRHLLKVFASVNEWFYDD
jgi:hypothetical protein